MIKCKNEVNGVCKLGIKNQCYTCDYLIPEADKTENKTGGNKMAKNLITRSQYKEIKKKDHAQMSDFLTRVWQNGFNDGLKQAKKSKAAAVKQGDIEKAIANVKGIGEVKLKAIMQQVYKLYEEASE